MAQSRSWFFTVNNPPALEGDDPLLHLHAERAVTYATYQLEQGENGTPHFQGCIYFQRKTRFGRVKTLVETHFGAVPHIETTRSMFDAVNYCQKEDTRVAGPWETGDREQVSTPCLTPLL